MASVIESLRVRDVRFPTSLSSDGSDAMHKDPDYSCAYVILSTDTELEGHGFTFTLGKATEVVVCCVKALSPIVLGRNLNDIFSNFSGFWRELTSESQMRWIGPEKGVIHLATAAIINAIWDLWAKIEKKPLWKLLVDMEPEKLVSTIDFRYITDVLTKEEAISILKANYDSKKQREKYLLEVGYPAYTTSVGWLGYDDDKVNKLCKEAMNNGFTKFKIKVGVNIKNDKERLSVIRNVIGPNNTLMVDANQCWDVNEAIDWMKQLAEFHPLWIEEPTSPDDILGHAAISKALNPLKIGVATGEQCQNRVMFKQFMQAGALQFCQIDCCRLGGVNEVMAVYLMASKFRIPVCPHAGGVGLCELVQHMAIWDYISLSANMENRMIEYVNHLHEHFKHPVKIKNGNYLVPKEPGYSTEMKEESLSLYEYPTGTKWMELLSNKE